MNNCAFFPSLQASAISSAAAAGGDDAVGIVGAAADRALAAADDGDDGLQEERRRRRAARRAPRRRAPIISFSHFLPRPELFVGFDAFRHVMGCRGLARQVRGGEDAMEEEGARRGENG